MPKVIEVKTKCMAPPPSSLGTFEWPDPNKDGTFTLSPMQALIVSELLDYVEEQYEACAK